MARPHSLVVLPEGISGQQLTALPEHEQRAVMERVLRRFANTGHAVLMDGDGACSSMGKAALVTHE
jgi:hypothetical protein